MSLLKRQPKSSSDFLSFFSFITYNSFVSLQLIHFLLWAKGSHENTNFDIFNFCDENLPNSSCNFPKHKSVFLQNTLHKRDQSANFLDFLLLRSKFTKVLSFLKKKIRSLQILHNCLVS